METEFSWQQVTDEYKRLGYRYPKDADFTPDEVAAKVASLPDSYTSTEEATLKGRKQTPAAIKRFAELAVSLGGDIVIGYEQLSVVREATQAERESRALDMLKSDRDTEQRRQAERSLASQLDLAPTGLPASEL